MIKEINLFFSIVRKPYQNSNIPTRIFYAAAGSEILSLVRTTFSQAKFQKLITIRFHKNG